jgi:1-acyl-sn-glycerol-3-phosphate acyltransferase
MNLRDVQGDARVAARAAAMAAFTAAMVQGYRLGVTVRPSEEDALRERWMRRWASGLLRVFGVEERTVGPAAPAATRGRLVIMNHRSPLDILLAIRHFGGTVLSRADLARWPLLGWAATHGATIYVDRDDPRSGMRALRQVRRRLEAGHTVTVFPEGTTLRGDEVRPFYEGAFAVLRGLDVELMPAGVAYEAGSEFVDEGFVDYMRRMAARPRTRVAVCEGQPQPSGGPSAAATAAQMRQVVQGLVTRAREAFAAP